MATHYHVHYRSQEGHERIGPRRFRSLASAMRESKKFPYVQFDGVRHYDFSVHLRPCDDTWSGCRYQKE